MLSLIKIRIKYLNRHKFGFFIGYLLLPLSAIIILIFMIVANFRSSVFETISYKKSNSTEIGDFYLFKKEYKYIPEYLVNVPILVDNYEDYNSLKNYIQNEIGITINYINSEDQVKSDFIHFINNKNKYRFELILRNFYSFNRFYFSDLRGFSTDFNTDIFNTEYLEDNQVKNDLLNRSINYDFFIEFQSLFSKYLIKAKANQNPNEKIKIKIGNNAYPDYNIYFGGCKESLKRIIYISISFITSLYFSLYTYFFIARMVDEKEKKLDIFLIRQGISRIKYFISWLVSYTLISIIPILSLFFFINYIVFYHSLLLIINMFMFFLSLFSIAFFFASIISTMKTSSSVVKLYNLVTPFLGIAIVLPATSKIIKIIFGFFPQVNFFLCFNSIIKLITFTNISWPHLWLKADKISYMESIILYIFQIIIYILLGLFFHTYQQSRTNFYNFLKNLFIKTSRNNNSLLENNENESIYEISHQEISKRNKFNKDKNEYLKIENVTKSFNSLIAVDDFNGEFFPGEIFCLLGNNGAGKTTLINMISGILNPNKGDIILNGISIISNKPYLFKNIGLCQQEDIFFDYLTVSEHLEYIYKIKSNKINKEEIDDLIKRIHLEDKKDSLCHTLSGGQKRKLCIALALIGNSKIVLLDEPSSGIDIMNKKELWDFLKDYKKNKIIILTTHSLDEAEYLGDRIGIILNGHFICSGTSSYLKTEYPCGFNINIIANPILFNAEKKDILFKRIKKIDGEASIKINSKNTFLINIKSNNSKNINKIFEYIDESKQELGITNYTLSSTTLEDIFLKINNYDLNSIITINNHDIILDENIIFSKGFLVQLKSQIKRNLYPLWRNKTLFIIEIISGLGCLYIFMIFFYMSNLFYFYKGLVTFYPFKCLDFVGILEGNRNYVYKDNKKYLKNSDVYKSLSNSITLTSFSDEPKNMEDFMEIVYSNSFANIAKGSIYFRNNSNYFDVYISEIFTGSDAYFLANTMLFISAFLKNEYDINASILTKIQIKNFDYILFEQVNMFKKFILLVVFFIGSILGYIIYINGLTLEKIKERITNIKHLLYLSGCNLWSYWIGFFVIDYIKIFFFSLLLLLSAIFYTKLVIYCWLDIIIISISLLPFIYFVSFFGSREDSGSKFILSLFFIFSFLIIFYAIVIVLDKAIKGDKASIQNNIFLKILVNDYFSIFDLTPISSMILSLVRLFLSIVDQEKLGKKYIYKSLILTIIIQLINFCFYGLLIILSEVGICPKYIHSIKKFLCINLSSRSSQALFTKELHNITNEELIIDDSLSREEEKNKFKIQNKNENNNNIISILDNEDPLNNPYEINEIENVMQKGQMSTKIIGLNKTYLICCCKKTRAVNNLYLCLEGNEKFGLLGYNGSGKTTIFKSITNEILNDSGKILLFGYDNKKEFNKIRQKIGYCPQINPLFDFMKVKEIIQFYLELKTLNENENLNSILKKFDLIKYLDTYCINLSGGNKRKLTLAIALMNKPNLLLLDEPSTGVDPLSKRIMWKNINDLSNNGHLFNMILTTHSMEEAEVLCDRVGWLDKGNFICIGNPEQLKLQNSQGYKLHIKFDDSIMNLDTDTLIKSENTIQRVYQITSSLILNFGKYFDFISDKSEIIPCIETLIDFIKKIKSHINSIEVIEIGKDFSFNLKIEIIQNHEKFLFAEIINIKNEEKKISELIIGLEPLENVLTSSFKSKNNYKESK